MKLSDFDYELPKELIAQFPPKRRDESRLIVLDRVGRGYQGDPLSPISRAFSRRGTSSSSTRRASYRRGSSGRRKSGGLVEVFLVRRLADRRWVAMLRPASRLRAGETVLVGERGSRDHDRASASARGNGS